MVIYVQHAIPIAYRAKQLLPIALNVPKVGMQICPHLILVPGAKQDAFPVIIQIFVPNAQMECIKKLTGHVLFVSFHVLIVKIMLFVIIVLKDFIFQEQLAMLVLTIAQLVILQHIAQLA